MKISNVKKISQVFIELTAHCQDFKKISLGDIKIWLHQYSFGLLMILFAIPCVLPLPAISLIGGLPLILFALQMIAGYDSPRLPLWLSNKMIETEHVVSLLSRCLPYLIKLESLSSRMMVVKNIVFIEKIVGIFSLIFAIYIALPVVFGNTLPSIGIIMMSFGLLNNNFLLIIIGIIVGMIGVSLASIVIVGGMKLLETFYHYL